MVNHGDFLLWLVYEVRISGASALRSVASTFSVYIKWPSAGSDGLGEPFGIGFYLLIQTFENKSYSRISAISRTPGNSGRLTGAFIFDMHPECPVGAAILRPYDKMNEQPHPYL